MAAQFPEAFQFLFQPARYKVAYGGRGGGKSQNIARALLALGAQRKLRILCCRETMKSISDSVWRLLCDQIVLMGLQEYYLVEKAAIRGKNNGTEILFTGLKDAAALKSKEGISILWAEEAASVSQSSLDVVIPTIRKDDCAIYSDEPKDSSEIWLSYNPVTPEDPVHKMFVIDEPPPDSIVRKISWFDNPWFPETLRKESEILKKKDIDKWNHVYGGECVQTLDGAVYSTELRQAESEGRIGKVPHDVARPVHCFFDLGWGDATAIWFVQVFMAEYRFIDYIEDSHKSLQFYLKLMQEKPYIYGNIWLPWDGGSTSLQTGKSILGQVRELGFRARSLPQGRQYIGISAMRGLFPNCWFDRKNCAQGLRALRYYRFGENIDAKTRTREPIHDWSSHAADSARTFAMAIQQPKTESPQNGRVIHQPQRAALPPTAWS